MLEFKYQSPPKSYNDSPVLANGEAASEVEASVGGRQGALGNIHSHYHRSGTARLETMIHLCHRHHVQCTLYSNAPLQPIVFSHRKGHLQ